MDLIDRLRAALDAEETRLHELPPWPWQLNPDDDSQVLAADGIEVAEAFALSSNQLRLVAAHIVAEDPGVKLRRIAADRTILDVHGQEHDCIELTASGDASVVDGKPWALWEPTSTEDAGRPCFVVRTLAEAYGIEAS